VRSPAGNVLGPAAAWRAFARRRPPGWLPGRANNDGVTLHRNAARVQAALVAAGSSAVVRELPESAHSSAEAAAALGVDAGQIAKTLVFVADSTPVLVVLRGADRLDPARLGAYLGAARVRRADADTVREATGFPIGGVSPIAHADGLRVIVDRALADYPVVWAAAGTPHAVFPTSFTELLATSGGEAADVRQI
jgi:prolyl-tRNA editing enzyme YbaK/EbsC (Cys-tRNA(Pro) deacylase)